jgi:hypothetical protein
VQVSVEAKLPFLAPTYHGALTHQFRNVAPSTSSKASVTYAPPFWKSRPPRAGRIANASGAESQTEGSSESVNTFISFPIGRGAGKREASELSDRMELRRRDRGLGGSEPSEKVAARLNIFSRRSGGICEPEV